MRIFSVVLVLAVLSLTSCERVEQAQPEHFTQYSTEWEMWPIDTDWVMGDEVLFFINEYRISKELDIVIKDTGLPSALAAQHCNYMIYTQQMSHDGFAYRAEILANNGSQSVGENVAFGYTNAQEVVNAWINSPSHRDVLEGNYNYAGLGIKEDVFGTKFFTLILLRK